MPAGRVRASPSVPTSASVPGATPPSRDEAVGVGALDLEPHRRPGQQVGDGPLADDPAPVDDGHRVARPLHLVEEVGREHDRAALGHQSEDHVAHVLHARRIEAVHRLVENEQLRIAEQASGHAEALAHAHRVLGHLVVGAVGDAHPLERRTDAAAGRGLAGRGQDLQVLAAGQVAVETWLVDDGAHPGQCLGPVAGHGVAEQRHGAGVGVGESEQHPDQRGLAGPVRAEVAEGAAPGDEEFDPVDGHVGAEALGQPVDLHGPVGPRAVGGGTVGEGRGHRSRPPWSWVWWGMGRSSSRVADPSIGDNPQPTRGPPPGADGNGPRRRWRCCLASQATIPLLCHTW